MAYWCAVGCGGLVTNGFDLLHPMDTIAFVRVLSITFELIWMSSIINLYKVKFGRNALRLWQLIDNSEIHFKTAYQAHTFLQLSWSFVHRVVAWYNFECYLVKVLAAARLAWYSRRDRDTCQCDLKGGAADVAYTRATSWNYLQAVWVCSRLAIEVPILQRWFGYQNMQPLSALQCCIVNTVLSAAGPRQSETHIEHLIVTIHKEQKSVEA